MKFGYKFLMMGALALGTAAAPAFAEDAKRVGDPYPLSVCAVAGEALGSMGDPITHVKDGREVKFCCAGCIKKYDAMTEQFGAAVDEKIIEQQDATYPLTVCANSGAPLGDSPTVFVAGNREFKTCCGNCKKAVQADPAKFIEKLDAAVIEKQAAEYKGTTCPISGKTIEGDGVQMVVANRLVKLCCPGCKGGVEKDVAGTLAKLDGKDAAEDKS